MDERREIASGEARCDIDRGLLAIAIGQQPAMRAGSLLLIEQRLTIALEISQRLYVMGHGRIVFEGTAAELRASESIRREWLEV